jgi:hypothetical protein
MDQLTKIVTIIVATAFVNELFKWLAEKAKSSVARSRITSALKRIFNLLTISILGRILCISFGVYQLYKLGTAPGATTRGEVIYIAVWVVISFYHWSCIPTDIVSYQEYKGALRRAVERKERAEKELECAQQLLQQVKESSGRTEGAHSRKGEGIYENQ